MVMEQNKEQDKHLRYELMSSYIYIKCLYSLSLADRVALDLEQFTFTPREYSEDLDSLSNEELEKKLRDIKEPWWNDLYKKKIQGNTKRLLALSTFFGIWFRIRHPFIYMRNLRYCR